MTATVTNNVAVTSPYQGLANFTEKDAAFFFGRDREQQIIIANLRARRLTLLYGESGVGKTSLLRAGVVAELLGQARENAKLFGSAQFIPVVFSDWRDNPLHALIETIREAADEFAPGHERMRTDWNGLGDAIQAVAEATDAYLLIILDQFEEYFIYQPKSSGGTFADEFPETVRRTGLQAAFMISIREDALAKLDQFKSRIPKLFDTFIRIEHLDAEAGRKAITMPLDEFNQRLPREQWVSVEAELVDDVLSEIRTGRVVLEQAGQGTVRPSESQQVDAQHAEPPLSSDDRIETPYLQLVMARLWDEERRLGSKELRVGTYRALGGAQKIVRTHLDAALGNLSPAERYRVADLFHQLVTPSGTKIAHTAHDLAEYARLPAEKEGEVQGLLERLARPDTRILRAVGTPAGTTGAERYEIFHDVLAPSILDWRTRQTEARRARQTILHRLVRLGAGVGVVAFAAIAALAIWALAQRDHAQTEATRAQSLVLATEAPSAIGASPAAPLTLSLAALAPYRAGPSSPQSALSATAQALQYARSQGLISVLQAGNGVYSVAFSPDGRTLAAVTKAGTLVLWDTATHIRLAALSAGAGNTVYSVAFSPDGRTLAAGTSAGTVLVWDAATLTRLAALSAGAHNFVSGVAFSPDGRTLAAGTSAGTVLLWDFSTHTRLATLNAGAGNAVESVAISPDGLTLAAGTNAGTVLLWDTATHTRLATLNAAATNSVDSVAFSPDGRTLAAGTSAGTVLLWDFATHTRLATLNAAAKNSVDRVAFSPDGLTLAAGTSAGTVLLWDTATHTRLAALNAGSGNYVYGVAFSPDGRTLAAGTNAGTVLVWDAATLTHLAALNAGAKNSVDSIAFGPDGRTLAAGTGAGTVLLWDFATHTQLASFSAGANNSVDSIAFGPDGRTLAAGTGAGTVLLWDFATHTQLASFSAGANNSVDSVAFSPDGRTLAAGTSAGTVLLWDFATHPQLASFSAGANNSVDSVAFSPDGRTLAAGTSAGTVLLWDTATHPQLAALSAGANNSVDSVAFSPDGRTLAAGTSAGTVLLWDTATHTRLATLNAGAGDIGAGNTSVGSVAFSPDGRTLAAGTNAGTVVVWDTATHTQLAPLNAGAGDAVESVAFSPDGLTLAAGTNAGTVRLFPGQLLWRNFAALREEICGIVPGGLTPAEWKQAAPGIPYQEPCR